MLEHYPYVAGLLGIKPPPARLVKPRFRITEETIKQVRDMYKKGMTHVAISRELGNISSSHVGRIVRGEQRVVGKKLENLVRPGRSISSAKIAEIRKMAKDMTYYAISKKLGVSVGYVWKVVNGHMRKEG